jgi:hypothetical protein
VVEVNTRMHKVLDHGDNPNPEVGPAPLQEGVTSTNPLQRPFPVLKALGHDYRGPGYVPS